MYAILYLNKYDEKVYTISVKKPTLTIKSMSVKNNIYKTSTKHPAVLGLHIMRENKVCLFVISAPKGLDLKGPKLQSNTQISIS